MAAGALGHGFASFSGPTCLVLHLFTFCTNSALRTNRGSQNLQDINRLGLVGAFSETKDQEERELMGMCKSVFARRSQLVSATVPDFGGVVWPVLGVRGFQCRRCLLVCERCLAG